MRNTGEDNFVKVAAILLWKYLALQVNYQSLKDRLRIQKVEKQGVGESQKNLGFHLEKYTQPKYMQIRSDGRSSITF